MAREQLEIPLDDPNEHDDTPVEVVIDEKAAEKSAKSTPQDTDHALNQLRQQLEAERLARYQAEQNALAASQAAQKATSKKATTEVQMVKSAIKTLKRDTKMLRDAYQQALQVGDAAEASKINEKLVEVKGNLKDLEKGYNPLKKEAKQAKEGAKIEPQKVNPPAPTASQQLDQIINSVTPRSAAWLKANRDAIQDQRTINKMFRAHEDAVDDGIEPDSDAYFRYIEGRLGMGQQKQADSPYSHASRPSERSVAPPAAPVNNGYGNRPGTVTLTRAEADMASALGMSPKEYAEHKIALQKEGRL
jgi:uncharacterized phage infection (PIP) family protein YhgE